MQKTLGEKEPLLSHLPSLNMYILLHVSKDTTIPPHVLKTLPLKKNSIWVTNVNILCIMLNVLVQTSKDSF